jgi:hypothetical protein
MESKMETTITQLISNLMEEQALLEVQSENIDQQLELNSKMRIQLLEIYDRIKYKI